MGQQQNDVRVVMGEAAVLGKFRGAAGVSNSDVRGDDNIRRAWVHGRIVVVNGKRRTIVNLAEFDSGGGGVIFEDFDARKSIGRVVQPDQRDVIFGRSNAGGVVGRFREGNESGIRKQSDGGSAGDGVRDVAVWVDRGLGGVWR